MGIAYVWLGQRAMFDPERSAPGRSVFALAHLFLAYFFYYLRRGYRPVKTALLTLFGVTLLDDLTRTSSASFAWSATLPHTLYLAQKALELTGAAAVGISLAREPRPRS